MQEIYGKKMEERVVQRHNALLYQKIKPLVLAQVEEDLQNYFEKTEARRVYMDTLLRELQDE